LKPTNPHPSGNSRALERGVEPPGLELEVVCGENYRVAGGELERVVPCPGTAAHRGAVVDDASELF
jgi:hypothetical protein